MTIDTVMGGLDFIYTALSLPTAVAVSRDGDELFVYDGVAALVFRAFLVDGYPSPGFSGGVFAGGVAGNFGDGGVSVFAGLSSGGGLAVTPSGELIISDSGAVARLYCRLHMNRSNLFESPPAGNNRLRIVAAVPDTARTLSVIAGTGALSPYVDNAASLAATVPAPAYVATQSNGDVIFSDASRFVVRSVSYGGGIVARLAGTSGVPGFVGGPALSARLGRPAGICTMTYPSTVHYFAGESIGCACSVCFSDLVLPARFAFAFVE